MDREKVIKGLECCAECGKCKNECPYDGKNNSMYGCTTRLAKDALELLKAQEPVKPEREHSGGGTTWWNVCGACKTAINPNDKYCHECGRAVKWDG